MVEAFLKSIGVGGDVLEHLDKAELAFQRFGIVRGRIVPADSDRLVYLSASSRQPWYASEEVSHYLDRDANRSTFYFGLDAGGAVSKDRSSDHEAPDHGGSA